MNHLKLFLAIFLVILIAIPFGCTTQKTTSSSMKVGYVPIADCLQIYVAQDKGFFAKQGLTVELVPLQSGPRIIEALVAKSVDAGVSNVVSTIISHSKGVPVVAITGGPLETEAKKTKALMVLSSSPIQQPKDLAGKTIAVNALRNIEHVMLQQYLIKNGVPVESVKVVEAPFPQMEGILKGGSADAVMAIEPYISLSLKNNSARILGHPYTEFRPRNVVTSYNVRTDWLRENQETAKKFATAIAEATDFISKNDAEARQILIKYTNIPQDVAQNVVIPEFQGKYQPDELQPWIEELAKQGILEKTFNAQEVFQQQ